MKAHHFASGLTTVTYSPPTVPGKEVAGGRIDLAFSAVCHFCGVVHISVLRAFPTPYRCSVCAATHRGEIPPPSKSERPGPTPAQVALLARIAKIAARIAKLTDRLEVERERRDKMFVKAQGMGLTSREIGAVASMSSPGVVGAQARAKERRANGR